MKTAQLKYEGCLDTVRVILAKAGAPEYVIKLESEYVCSQIRTMK